MDWFTHGLNPRRVAIVGASDDPARSRYLLNLQRGGFDGEIYPVNPNRETVLGLPAYPDLGSLPAAVDLAIVMVPAAAIADATRNLAASEAKLVYIGSGGFGELGEDGDRLQELVVARARDAGARVLGPNGNGVMNAHAALFTTSSGLVEADYRAPGPRRAALVTQSGALGVCIRSLALANGLDIDYYIATGNECDISLAEAIERLLEEPSVSIILCYVEGIRDGDRFIRAAARAHELGKTIVTLKVGRSAAGAKMAASHTAAVAGDIETFDGICRQFGIVVADSVTELVDIGRLVAHAGADPGRRLGIVSVSGGIGGLLVDAMDDSPFEIPSWPEPVAIEMGRHLPSFAGLGNPVDGSGALIANEAVLGGVLAAAHGTDATDLTIFATGLSHTREPLVSDVVAATAAGSDKPLIVVWIANSGVVGPRLNPIGIPVFDDVPGLARALRAVAHAASATPDRPGSDARRRSRTDITPIRRPDRSGVLDEVESKRILAEAGLPVVAEFTVPPTAARADFNWPTSGFPFVAKLISAALPHKSESGGVWLGLESRDAVERAGEELYAIADELGLDDAVVVLQPQIPSGTELLLGMKRDPTFGPVVVLGHGGVFSEALRDLAIAVPPLRRADIERMLAGLRHTRLTQGFRGRPAVTLDSVADTVMRFADLVLDLPEWVDSIDVNPLIVTSPTSSVIVDALFVVSRPAD